MINRYIYFLLIGPIAHPAAEYVQAQLSLRMRGINTGSVLWCSIESIAPFYPIAEWWTKYVFFSFITENGKKEEEAAETVVLVSF